MPIIIIGKIEELSKAMGKSNKAILGIEDINLSKEIQKINNGGDPDWINESGIIISW